MARADAVGVPPAVPQKSAPRQLQPVNPELLPDIFAVNHIEGDWMLALSPN